MIAYLKGTIISQNEESIIIENNGLGYDVFIPKSTLTNYPENCQAELFIYHHINDSGQTLFGFPTSEDRKLFLHLISVSGIGPKTALQFFDYYPSSEIVSHITSGNLAAISKISGIGKKSSERIILELKDKLTKLYGPTYQVDGGVSINCCSNNLLESAFKEDLIGAFIGLGYNKKQIEELIEQNSNHLSEHQSVEESIRFLLSKS